VRVGLLGECRIEKSMHSRHISWGIAGVCIILRPFELRPETALAFPGVL
jgi:hypothetical protein